MATGVSTEEQKQTFGERLFPLVQRMYPGLAAKVTGMLLELDISELQKMLESKDILEAKVHEAVAVLQGHLESVSTNEQGNTSDGLITEEQRRIFGERLYPLIQRMYPVQAAKITGMLLEMDVYELQHILESNESLEAKVNEAVAILRSV